MSEFYSNGERALIFGIIIAFSFIITLIYLCCRIDRKNISWFIFIICWLSSSLFIFLNIIAMFDTVFNNHKGFEKFSKFISKFYQIYDYIDKALGFLIFPFIISYLESGGFSICRRIWDAFLGIIKEFIESLILSFKILILIAMLIILIKYRKHFGLGNNPIDYLFVILDCYAIVDIYICVGFFMVQIFIDCKRKSKNELSERYYRYSIIKIIEQTDKDIDDMQTLYESLNKNMEKYQKEKSPSDLDNIKNLIKKIEVIINQYRLEANKVNNNNISNVNSTTNINNNNNQDNPVDNINKANLYNVNKNTKPDNKDFRPETFNALKVNEKKIQNLRIKENNNEDPVECNTKFQEYERRIDRSRKLFKELGFSDEEIKDLTIPQNVTSIGQIAFAGCSGLSSVIIPNNIVSIGREAFFYCSGLSSITIPNSITSIESGVFQGCSGLTSVDIPNSVTDIGMSAFRDCCGLSSIVIPVSPRSEPKYSSINLASSSDSIDSNLHILDLLYNRLKDLQQLNLEFNSLDQLTFYKMLNLIYKNQNLLTLNISFFSSDITYFLRPMLKIYNQIGDAENLIKYNNINIEETILNSILPFFLDNLSTLFVIIKKLKKIENLGLNFDLPIIVSNQQSFIIPLIKFILNIIFLIDNKKIKKLTILAPSIVLDERILPRINEFFSEIDINKGENDLIELNLQIFPKPIRYGVMLREF